MKTKKDTCPQTLSGRDLEAFAAQLNQKLRDDAMRSYLYGDEHNLFWNCPPIADVLKACTGHLKKGKIWPVFDFFGGPERFVKLFSTRAGCYCRQWLMEEDTPSERTLTVKERQSLLDTPPEEVNLQPYGYFDREESYAHPEDRQKKFELFKALLEYFKAAAGLALKIGSESSRDWAEAVRLLQPPLPMLPSSARKAPLPEALAYWKENDVNFRAATLERVHTLALGAQAALWNDNYLYGLRKAR